MEEIFRITPILKLIKLIGLRVDSNLTKEAIMAKKTVKTVSNDDQQQLAQEARGYWDSIKAVIAGKNLPKNLSDISILVRDPIRGFDYDAIRFDLSSQFLPRASLRATLLNKGNNLVLIVNQGQVYPRGAQFANLEDGFKLKVEVFSRLVPVIESLAPLLVESAAEDSSGQVKEKNS